VGKLKFSWRAAFGSLFAMSIVIQLQALLLIAVAIYRHGWNANLFHKSVCACSPHVDKIFICFGNSVGFTCAALLIPAAVLILLQIWLSNQAPDRNYLQCAAAFAFFSPLYAAFLFTAVTLLGRPQSWNFIATATIFFAIALAVQGLCYRLLSPIFHSTGDIETVDSGSSVSESI
jgi:Kef-type K+ transport system membrane component KefB